MTEQVAKILTKHGQFQLECRGPIEVRGKGILTTYFVVTPYDNVETNNSLQQPEQLDPESCLEDDEVEEPEPPPTLDESNDEVEELY